MKKVIGFILLGIALLNIVGLFAALGRGTKLPFPPMYYILLVGLVILGLNLVLPKKVNNTNENQ